MSKKLSYYDRKRLYEAKQSGLSDTRLKDKFGIVDNRTLKRQLKLAEQEAESKSVKLEILKDALVDHLAEVRTLIGDWNDSLSTPLVGSIHFEMPSIPTQHIEDNPLFNSLKEHLPFPTLWRNYRSWKANVRSYIEGCQQVMKEIGEAEKHSVPEEIFRLWGTESTTKALRLADPVYRMMAKYKETVEADDYLNPLLEIISPIETRLHKSLQEIQFRHDHIAYTCKLCPGQPKLSR